MIENVLADYSKKKLHIKENLLFFETQISFFKCFISYQNNCKFIIFLLTPIEKGYLGICSLKSSQNNQVFSSFFVK